MKKNQQPLASRRSIAAASIALIAALFIPAVPTEETRANWAVSNNIESNSISAGSFQTEALGRSTEGAGTNVSMATDHMAANNRLELEGSLGNHFTVRTTSNIDSGVISGDDVSLEHDSMNLLADDFTWEVYGGRTSCSPSSPQNQLLAYGNSLDDHSSTENSVEISSQHSSSSALCAVVQAKEGSDVWPNQPLEITASADAIAVNNSNNISSWKSETSASSEMMTWGGGDIEMYWLTGDDAVSPTGEHTMGRSTGVSRGTSQMRNLDTFIYTKPTNPDGRYLHTETQTRGWRVGASSPNSLWDLAWRYHLPEGSLRLADHLTVHAVENLENKPCREWIPQDSQEARDVIDNRADLHIARVSEIGRSSYDAKVERIRPSRINPGEQLLHCLVYEFNDPNGEIDDLDGEDYFVSATNHYISAAHEAEQYNG